MSRFLFAEGDTNLSEEIIRFLEEEKKAQKKNVVVEDPSSHPQSHNSEPVVGSHSREDSSSQSHKTNQKTANITFVYNGLTLVLDMNNATPSALAGYFELNWNEIQLTRKDKIYNVHKTEDKFEPLLLPGKRYTVKLKERKSSPPPIPKQRQKNECILVVNDQQKVVPSGTVKKAAITALFKIQPHSDIRLIGYDGNVIENKNQYDLNPGATYYIRFDNQKHLKKESVDVQHHLNDTFSKPLASMAPFMAAVVRIIYVFSSTGDAVPFNENQLPKLNDKETKLHCTKKLSTCAYQVAYRYNTALEAILSFSTKQQEYRNDLLKFIPNYASEDDEELTEKPHETWDFFRNISNIIQILENADSELKEFLQIVISEMNAANPSIESVKIALKIETNQEKRVLEKEKQKDVQVCNLQEMCNAICKGNDTVYPKSDELYSISSNRKFLNMAIENVEKILSEIDDNPSLEDIANLLDFCAKVSHCNLMHWIFASNVWHYIVHESEDAVKVSQGYINQVLVSTLLCKAIKVWEYVSDGEPLNINLNEDSDNAQKLWEKLKAEIIASQYALEICYND